MFAYKLSNLQSDWLINFFTKPAELLIFAVNLFYGIGNRVKTKEILAVSFRSMDHSKK